jgi:hypothetical protein
MITLSIREENMKADLSADYEWITAHVLVTTDIWYENGGPSAYGFSPVYTYPGKGSKNIGALGGVKDENGDYFYTSYPPFAFIAAYYSTVLFGPPDVHNLRVVSLIIHFFCAFLIYLIIRKLSNREEDHYSIAGVFGAFLYLFSTGTLWIHSLLFFSDMLVQLLLIWSVYLLIRFLQKDYKKEVLFLAGFGTLIFLGTYTEWVALFFAFFSGITVLTLYFINKQKRFLKAFFVIGLSSAFAVSIMLLQYSSIAGFQKFKEVATLKYSERSGHEAAELTPNNFNLESEEAFTMLTDNIDQNFSMAENLLLVFSLLLIPFIVWRRTREKMKKLKWKLIIPLILVLSISTHYYLFYNFNALHNFSNLKLGFLIILCIAILVLLVEEAINTTMKVGLFILVAFYSYNGGLESVELYYTLNQPLETNDDRVRSARLVNKHHDPDKYAFISVFSTPAYMFEAQHVPFPAQDTSQMREFMNANNISEAQFYQHEGSRLDYMLEIKNLGNRLIVLDRIDFDD